jgi:hypothetical protein
MACRDQWQRLPLLVRLKGAFANRSGYQRKTRMDLLGAIGIYTTFFTLLGEGEFRSDDFCRYRCLRH